MNEVAKRAGLMLTYRVTKNWGEIFKAIRAGDIDIIPSLGVSDNRKQYVAFTQPVDTFRIVLFIRDDTQGVTGIDDMKGRPVAVVFDNVGYRLLENRTDIQLEVFLKFTDALFALLSAKVDAFAYPEPVTWKLAREAEVSGHIKVAAKPLIEIKRAMAVRKDNTELLAVLDRAVKDFVASPEYRNIYVAWFGKPDPFWTVSRVSWAMGGSMAVLFLSMVWWRYRVGVRMIRSLRESEYTVRLVTDSVPALIAYVDSEERYRFANEPYRTSFGLEPENIIGKHIKDIIGEGLYERTLDKRNAVMSGKSQHFEDTMVDGDGNTRYIQVALVPHFGDVGGVLGYYAMIQDITERKRAEERLRESQEQYQDLYDNAPDMFCSVDAKTSLVIQCNQTLVKNLGLSKDEIIGRPIFDLYHPDSHEKANAYFLEFLDTGQIHSDDMQLLRKDGGRVDVSLRVTSVRDESGNIISSRSVWRDITDLNQAEEDRRQALIRAEEASQAKSEFMATMSHELRTPLNAIMGFSEMLTGKYFGELGSKKYEEYADDIHTSSEHLLHLVNDILDLSAIEAGEQPLTKETLRVKDVVADCSPIIVGAANGKNIEYSVEVPENLPPLHADRRALRQILLNLLSNAVKFTLEGGRITLSSSASNGRLTIEVSDSGIGISAKDLPSLTDPFKRAKSDPYLSQEGTGLGLAIVKALVELHDGDLLIESEPGRGTTVTVTLPNGAP